MKAGQVYINTALIGKALGLPGDIVAVSQTDDDRFLRRVRIMLVGEGLPEVPDEQGVPWMEPVLTE